MSGTGQIAPGNSVGTLSVTGNVTFTGGSLVEELATGAGSSASDLLAVTGNLKLSDSTLSLSGGAAGVVYTIVTYTGVRTGIFASVTPGYTVDYSQPGKILVGSAGASALKITSVTKLSNGHIFLQCAGVPNANHSVLFSPDFGTAFVRLDAVAADGTGAFSYEDVGAGSFTKRFYRLSFP